MTLLRSLRTTFSALTSWLADALARLKGHNRMATEQDSILNLPPAPGAALTGREVMEAVSDALAQVSGYPNVRLTVAQIAAFTLALGGLGVKAVNAQAGTSYIAVAADAARWTDFTNAGAVTFTIDGNQTYPADAEIEFSQSGAGIVTVAGANGVTIQSRGGIVTTAGQFAIAMLKRKGSTNNWLLTGDVA
jgi:hypothetical protein